MEVIKMAKTEKEIIPEVEAPKEVIFYCSEYPELSVVVVPQSMDTINGKKVFHEGKEARFANGEYKTSDIETIEVIRKNQWYGLKIVEEGADHSKIQKG